MRIAHVRERHAPAGAPWRLAAADPSGRPGGRPGPLDRPRAGPSAGRRRPSRARARQRPPPPAADDARRPARAPACGSRRCATSSRASRRAPTTTRRSSRRTTSPSVRRCSGPPSIRDFYAFEGHVRTMWERRGGEVPEAWYRLPIFYFSNVSEVRGPGDPVWAPAASSELDYELEVAALIDTPGRRPRRRATRRAPSAATRSSTTGRRATSSARRRPSGSGRRRARTSRAPSDRGS